MVTPFLFSSSASTRRAVHREALASHECPGGGVHNFEYLAQQSPELAGEILIGMLGAKSPKLAGFRFPVSIFDWLVIATNHGSPGSNEHKQKY